MLFIKKYKWHVALGIISGFVNGLLGAGGGIIVTYFLARALDDENKKDGGIFANAVATMLPISVFSFAVYLVRGYFSFDRGFLYLLLPGVLGGILGAFLLSKINSRVLKIAFSLLVVVSGISMIFK